MQDKGDKTTNKHQLKCCLEELLGAASVDGVMTIEDAVQFSEMEGTAFGVNERSITFFCAGGKTIKFTQIEDGAHCKVEYNLDDCAVSVDFYGRNYPGLTHNDIFAFYFDT